MRSKARKSNGPKRRRSGRSGTLGPSNDDIPLDEIAHATFAKDDGYWALFDDPDGHDWDVTRPLREQWPWCPADPAHMARSDAQIDEVVESTEARLDRLQAETASAMAALFASVDEPVHAWRPGRPEPPDDAIRSAASGNNHDPGWQERVEAKIELMRRSRGDEFAPSDTASREPWHTTEETQLSDACSAAVDALDRAETKLKELRDFFAESVTEVPEGAA